MSCVLIYSKNTLFRKGLEEAVLKTAAAEHVSCIDNICDLSELFPKCEYSYFIIDIFSRNFDENLLPVSLQFFNSSQIILVTTSENQYVGYYRNTYDINNFIYAEEDADRILAAFEHIFSGNGVEKYRKSDSSLLTSRECEILKLIAIGNTSKEIAEQLCISKNTVDTHRNKMLQKLNLANSASLVHYAYKSGLF